MSQIDEQGIIKLKIHALVFITAPTIHLNANIYFHFSVFKYKFHNFWELKQLQWVDVLQYGGVTSRWLLSEARKPHPFFAPSRSSLCKERDVILHWLPANTTALCLFITILIMGSLDAKTSALELLEVPRTLLTGTSFLSFRMGTLGGIVDCRSAGLSLSPLCGEFSPLPTTTTTEAQLSVWQRN